MKEVLEVASTLFADAKALDQADPESRDAVALRERIRDLAFDLHSSLLGPAEILRTYASHGHLISLHFIQRFKIATIVPVDGGLCYRDIAAACGQRESTVRRILRHAIGLQVFREEEQQQQIAHPPPPPPHLASSSTTTTNAAVDDDDDDMSSFAVAVVVVVRHTPASLLLRDPAFHAWVGATCEESWPAATRTVDALAAHPAASEPSESGWALAHSHSHAQCHHSSHSSSSSPSSSDSDSESESLEQKQRQSLYAIIAADPARASRFASAMSAYSVGSGYAPAHLIEACRRDLEGLPRGARFVDVGGGLGQFAVALRGAFGQLDFVVQDLPEVVKKAAAAASASADGRSESAVAMATATATATATGVRFQAHDFFTPQPEKEASVYFLRWILHNWSDKYAVEILRHIGAAMGAGSRLIIHDYCLPRLEQLSLRQRQATTNMDLGMLQLLNAQERDEQQWRALLAEASPGLRWMGVTRPQGSALAIMEAVWEPAK
ncbi:S-adenosyl-L-methionine-dependent methyltransferase [Xylariaceae sp. FL0804]|nr:S-adenosyl-L-methionine-dependent methyltransferase [Xylariaceae sp. FL0804]